MAVVVEICRSTFAPEDALKSFSRTASGFKKRSLTVSICDGSLDKVPSTKSGLRTLPTSIYHGTVLKTNTIFQTRRLRIII